MQTLKQRAIAFVGAIALGGLGTGFAAAADIPLQPAPRQYYGAAPQYGPPPAEEAYPYAPPPVVYGPPPAVYYDYPPPVAVAPVYPRRYYYAHGAHPYARYGGYRGYAPYYAARGYRHRGGHWHH